MKQSLFKLAIAILAALSGFLTAQITGCGALELQDLKYTPVSVPPATEVTPATAGIQHTPATGGTQPAVAATTSPGGH